jgi:hypothetical protein
MLTLPQLDEVWKPVNGYSHYEVSNHGRVRSITHTTLSNTRWGTLRELVHEGRMLKITHPKSGYGYAEVKLCEDGVAKTTRVHVLVANAFLGKPPKGKSNVLHKDDDPRNAHVLNLEWGSQQDNLTDMRLKKRTKVGSAHGASYLTEKDVRRIVKLLNKGSSCLGVANEYGVADGTIRSIRDGVTWSHVTGFEWRGGNKKC